MFLVTQMVARGAGVTTSPASQPDAPHKGSMWTLVGKSWKLSESQGYKDTNLENKSS